MAPHPDVQDPTRNQPRSPIVMTPRNPQQEMVNLHIEVMKEIFTPEEQGQITLESRRNSLDLHGPEDLKRRLFEAVNEKIYKK